MAKRAPRDRRDIQIAGSIINARFGLQEVWNLVEVLYKIFRMMTNLRLQKMVLEQKIGFLPSSNIASYP